MRATSTACLLGMGLLLSLPTGSTAATLTIPGTGACGGALKGVATDFERSHPLAKVVIPPSVHSEGGIGQVLDGKAVLARVSRRLTPEETEKGLTQLVFARDAIVFGVGNGVTARNLTIRQLAEIFSGKIGTWEQLKGGSGAIRVLYRQAGDSNLARLRETFKEFRDLRFTQEGKMVYFDDDMLGMLRKYRKSVGFLTLSGINDGGAPISILALDGVAPTKGNIVAGRYPFVIEYALVYRKGALPPVGGEFIDFLFSDEGRKSLSGHGLVPVAR
ncbi:MAG: PstS family phosphate ABC transporter substrate-binding protein [Candidatus Deferrimicrobiaceae bacterium]